MYYETCFQRSSSVTPDRCSSDHVFGFAEFGPIEPIRSDEHETHQRHHEAKSHIVHVAEMAHKLWHERAAGYRHHDERRRFFSLYAETVDTQGENRREHDRHEEKG